MGAISNLPTNPNEIDSTPSSVRPTAGRSFLGVQLELNDQFQIPRASTSTSVSSGQVIPKARSGHFIPYARGNTVGTRRVNRTTKSSLRTFACYLIPDGVMFQGVQLRRCWCIKIYTLTHGAWISLGLRKD